MRCVENGESSGESYSGIDDSPLMCCLQGSALLLGDIDIGHLMESLVLFVEQQNLIKSPLVLSKIVELILAMLSPQVNVHHTFKYLRTLKGLLFYLSLTFYSSASCVTFPALQLGLCINSSVEYRHRIN